VYFALGNALNLWSVQTVKLVFTRFCLL